MAKLVNPDNPREKYEPPLCRFASMLPLEADAIRKRGLPVLPPYTIDQTPRYSCPKPAKKNGLALFYADVQDYESTNANGDKCAKKGLVLTAAEGLNLSIEQSGFSARVFCADEAGVREIPLDEKHLVRIPPELAMGMLECLPWDSEVDVYFVGPGTELIRLATPKDIEGHYRYSNAMFMLGRSDLFPPGEIKSIIITYG